jgi:hypothetical protein
LGEFRKYRVEVMRWGEECVRYSVVCVGAMEVSVDGTDFMFGRCFLPGRSRYSVKGTEYIDYSDVGCFWKLDLMVDSCFRLLIMLQILLLLLLLLLLL